MKRTIYFLPLLLIVSFLFTQCIEEENNDDLIEAYNKMKQEIYEQYQIDSVLIENYLVENDSVAMVHKSAGFFYNIINEGSNYHPTGNSIIMANYKGTLMDGTVFDKSEENKPLQQPLSGLISGWQRGLPLIGEGGKIILYLPSFYGYGRDTTIALIPANSVLIFEVELLGFYGQ